jgi:hypothetical protein
MQKAQISGIHRCKGSQTKYYKEGEEFIQCSCCDSLTWQCWFYDNVGNDMLEIVLIGTGIWHAMGVLEIPEEGETYNFGGGMLKKGLYKVTKIAGFAKPPSGGDKEYIHIMVERVGDIVPNKMIYGLAMLNC